MRADLRNCMSARVGGCHSVLYIFLNCCFLTLRVRGFKKVTRGPPQQQPESVCEGDGVSTWRLGGRACAGGVWLAAHAHSGPSPLRVCLVFVAVRVCDTKARTVLCLRIREVGERCAAKLDSVLHLEQRGPHILSKTNTSRSRVNHHTSQITFSICKS